MVLYLRVESSPFILRLPDEQGAPIAMHEERIGQKRWTMLGEADSAQLDALLREFLSVSGAKCALLVDKDGYLVTQQGEALSFNKDTISALVAGGYGATKEIARLLGEDEFSVLYHQGKRESIQLTLISDRVLLTVIFDDRTTLGMVRLYSQEAARKIAMVLQNLDKTTHAVSGPALADDFAANAREKLDNLFG